MPDVYALYDKSGDMLYVGSAKISGLSRAGWHRKRQPWGGDVRWVQVIPADDLEDARKREMELIDACLPKHNIIGNPNPIRGRKYEPDDAEQRAHRAIWLDGNKSESARIKAISALYGSPVKRGALNHRYGWPSKPKPEEPLELEPKK